MRVQHMDGRILSQRQSNDAMLTTSNRLNADPAAPLPDGALGCIYNGTFLGGNVPVQADLDAALAKIVSDPSLLSVKERADIGAIMTRYSGRTARPTSGVGITANDEARQAVREAAQGVERVQAVQKMNDDFWARQNKLLADA